MLKVINYFLFTLIFVSCNEDYYANTELYIEETKISVFQECPTNAVTGFAHGDGSPADPFQICKVEHLDSLRDKLSNPTSYPNYYNKNYIVMENLDLTDGGIFYPIGNITDISITDNVTAPNAFPFDGEFDGNGKSISNLNILEQNTSYVGFFQYLGPNAFIHDFNLDGSIQLVGYSSFVGGIAGYSEGTISDITINISIIGSNGFNIGSIAGYQKLGQLNDIDSIGYIGYTGINSDIGGVVGFVENNTQLLDITSSVSVNGIDYIGGIAGTAKNYVSFDNVTSMSSVNGIGDFIGGIVGFADDGIDFIDIFAKGNVTTNGDHVGGIAGWFTNGSASQIDCSAITVTGGDFIGTFFGEVVAVDIDDGISDCSIVSTGDYIGGLVGKASDGTLIQNSDISTTITGVDRFIGGVIGYADGDIELSSIVASVDLDGSQYIGGLIGYSYSGLIIDDSNVISNSINGDYYVGGAVGFTRNDSFIDNVNVSSAITGQDLAGGIVGYAENDEVSFLTDIYQSNFSGSVDGRNFVGGIIGQAKNGLLVEDLTSITDIHCTGFSCGGIVGMTHNQTDVGSWASTIKNVAYSNDVSGKQLVGGIVGNAERNITITNVNVSGNISSEFGGTGGIIGKIAYSGTITNSVFSGNVMSTGSNVGGIAGEAIDSTIKDITGLTSINVSGLGNVGGVVGNATGSSLISDIQVSGTISATSSPLGGVVGSASEIDIVDVSFRGSLLGDIVSTAYVGGIIGFHNSPAPEVSSISTSYVVINSKSGVTIGAIVGGSSGTLNSNNIYFDKDITGIATSAYATGLINSHMYIHIKYVGFDFQNTWDLPAVGIYPALK